MEKIAQNRAVDPSRMVHSTTDTKKKSADNHREFFENLSQLSGLGFCVVADARHEKQIYSYPSFCDLVNGSEKGCRGCSFCTTNADVFDTSTEEKISCSNMLSVRTQSITTPHNERMRVYYGYIKDRVLSKDQLQDIANKLNLDYEILNNAYSELPTLATEELERLIELTSLSLMGLTAHLSSSSDDSSITTLKSNNVKNDTLLSNKGIVLLDDYIITRINKNALDTFKQQEGNVVSTSFNLYIHPSDKALFASKYEECVKHNISYHTFDCRLKIGADYQNFYLTLSCIDSDPFKTVLCYLSSGVLAIDNNAKDHDLEMIVNHVKSSILKVNEHGIVEFINNTVLSFYNGEANCIQGQSIYRIKDFFVDKSTRNSFYKAFENQQEATIEYQVKRPDESIFWLRSDIFAIYNETGEYKGIVVETIPVNEYKEMEMALRESEQLFRELTNLGETLLFTLSSDSRLTYINKFGCDLLGSSLEEIIGTNIKSYVFEDDRECFLSTLNKALNGESHEECEFRIYNSEGELCWMYAIFTSRYNIIGQIIGVLVQCTDLTERKKTELCLLASERKYRELADSGETLIMKLDLDFNCIYINEIGSVFIGYNSEDLVGTDPLECDEILDKTIYKEKLQEVVDTQQPLTFICEIEHISGAQRWLRNSLTPLYDDHGVLNGILHQAVDITDQKEIELALSLSESQFKDLANIGDIQVYVLDIDGYFTYVNKPAESFCERDICGLHYRDVFDVYEMPYCDDIYSTHEKQIFDHIKYLPNDKYVWHHSTFLPRYNQNNEFIGVISQCIDVTERKNDALLLEKSEQEYRMLSNLGEIHILKYNKDRAYTYANSLVLDFWSKTENDVYGKSLQEVFELKETETFINAFQLQQSVTLECAFQCKGQNYYFRCYLTPLFDEKHQFNGMLEQRINITEQREAELKLKESESRYRDLANSGETYIAVFGTDKCCTYVNQQICGYLGRSEEELLGEYVDNFLPLNAEQKPEFGEMFINHSSKVFQIETMKYNGETHWLRCMCTPLFSDDNFIGVLTHSIDVSEQLESQRKLEKSEEKYRLLANSGEALIAVFDSNYCCTFINEPFVNFSGITEERALGKAVDRFMIPDTEALSQFKALFTWPRKKEFEVQFPSSDNSLHWTRCLCTPLYDNDEFNGMLVQAYDIHKRKTIELALEQNERQYRDLANSGETLVWVADKNNIINYANQLLSDFSNVPIDSIVGSKTPMRYHHEDSIRVAKEFYKLPLAQKKITIEFRVYNSEEKIRWIRTIATPKFDSNGLYIGYIGQAYDITEHKNAELNLISSEKRYRALANSGETFIVQINKEFEVLFANERLIRFVGKTEKELLANKDLIEIHPEDKNLFEEKIKKAFNSISSIQFDCRFSSKNKNYHWIRVSATPQVDSDNSSVTMLIHGMDFTERKIAELALEESERRYKELANSGDTIIILVDTKLRCTYVNKQFLDYLGVKEDDILGEHLKSFVHQEDLESNKIQKEQIYKFKDFVTENRVLRNDGEYRWIRSAFSVRYDKQKNILGYIIHNVDITDRKESEIAIAESERSYRELANSGETLVIIYNEELVCSYINKQVEEFTGIDSSYFIGKQPSLPVYPEEREEFEKTVNKSYSEKKPFIHECRIKRFDGEYRWIRINATPRFNSNNEFTGFITHNIDIHERRTAELVIEHQRNYFQNLINSGEAFIFVNDKDGNITYANTPMLTYLNVDEDNLYNRSIEAYIDKETIRYSKEEIQERILNGETVVHEQQLLNGKTGEYRWFRFVDSPNYDNNNVLTHWLVQAIDIDTVKKNEEALRISEKKVRVSEEYYRMLSNAGDNMVWVCDKNNVCTYVNEPWVDFTGKSLEDIIIEGFHSVLHPDDQEQEINSYLLNFPKHKQIISVNRFYHVVCGHYHWVRTLATPLFNESGEFTGYIGHCTDISEMIESELSLQDSEKRFREIFESLQDVFFALDIEGNILDISPSIKTLLNIDLDIDKLIGVNIKEFSSYLNIPDIYLAINNTIINNVLVDSEIIIHSPDGKDIVCSFCSQCYRNIAGEPERILGTLRNISKRKQSEKELKDQRLLYSSVMQYLPADAFRKDIDGCYLYVNERMCNRLGLEESDIIGFTSKEVMQKQLNLASKNILNKHCTILRLQNFESDHETIIKYGITIDKEVEYQCANNDIRYYHTIKLPVYNAEGEIIGSQGLEMDITDEKLNLFALQNTNEDLAVAIQKANAATALYDLAPSGYFILDKKGVIVEVNIAASLFTGKDRNELIGFTFSSVLSENSHSELKLFMERMQSNHNNPINCELHFKNNEDIIFTKAQGLYSENNNTYLITLVDISDLRQTESNLRREQELLAKTEQLAKTGSWRQDIASSEIIYSEEFAALLGYSAFEFKPIISAIAKQDEKFLKILDKESRLLLVEFLTKIRNNDLPCQSEIKYIMPDGTERWFYTQCQGEYDSDNNITFRVGFLNDITQRKESELAIKESEQQYRNILNLSPDGIVMITGRGSIIDISPMAARILSCTVEDARTHSICDLLESDTERRQMRNLINKAWNSAKVEADEFIFKTNHGSLICEITAKTVLISNSRTKRVMLNMRDISDRKIMTQKLIRSERLVSLGEMATAMAHEINQPLLSISLSLDNLMDRINKVAPQESEYIKKKGERIFSDVSRIGRLIDHVRAFSRDKSHDDDVISSEFDVRESIDNAMTIVSEQLRQHGIKIVKEIGNVENLVGNTYRFEQVVLNLLTNAKDALAEKKKLVGENFQKQILIRTYCDDTNNYVEVTDNGTGIKPDMVDAVLQPFFTTKESSGVGVGLAISFGIVKDLDGNIDIISDGETYTTFKLTLPIPRSKKHLKENK